MDIYRIKIALALQLISSNLRDKFIRQETYYQSLEVRTANIDAPFRLVVLLSCYLTYSLLAKYFPKQSSDSFLELYQLASNLNY